MVIFITLFIVLLPHAVCDAQIVNCGLWHPELIHRKYYQPGDLTIGSIIFQSLFLYSTNTFKENPPQPQLARSFIQNYQQVLALEFAVKEINEKPQVLPNITLGFDVCDSHLDARETFHAALEFLSPKERFVPNYKCDQQGDLMAITEELPSADTHPVVDVLGIYKIPQLLYGSASLSMDKNQAHFIYRRVPSRVHQFRGIIQLLLHFKWTWTGFIAASEVNLGWFRKVMFPEFSQKGICFIFMESFSSIDYDTDREGYMKSGMQFCDKILNSKVNVVVIYGDPHSLVCLTWLLSVKRTDAKCKQRGKVWILTAQMELKSSDRWSDWNIQDFHGALSFATRSHELQGFQSFLQSRNISSNKGGDFLKGFWENAFQCTFTCSLLGDTKGANCTGEERLESLPGFIFPMSITSESYAIYNAVYAVAHALHAMDTSKSKNMRKVERERMQLQNQQPWQLHRFLEMVSFNNSAGDQISFDQNGEFVAAFDIINWVTFPNQSFVKVTVGRLDPQAPPNETITINKDAIVWHSWFNQAQPLSACSDICHPGYSKKEKEGEPICCYDCIPCPEGKVADRKDMADCFTCPIDQYPNNNQTSCIPKAVVFLTYEEPLGITLAICALLLSLVAALVLMLFVKHHNSPIVKVNNRSLTYTLLVSLLLCFLCPLLNFGQPEKVTCILCNTFSGLIFAMAISCVLAKTCTVVIAFRATRPGSTLKNWVGKRLANSIILLCIIIEAAICVLRLLIFPPFPDTDMLSRIQEIILECNESSPTIFYFEVTYLEFLAIVSLTVAFLARTLPDAFNEAKFITFSMFAYSFLWLTFIPSYMYSKGKDTVVVKIFSILVSGAALLVFMFFPKCYIILWRPQLNIREQLRKRKL